MSRIYESNTDANFEGSARSGSFEPVQTTDSSKKIREYKEALVRDGNTREREETRRQSREGVVRTEQQKTNLNQLRTQNQSENLELEMDQLVEKGLFDYDQLTEKTQFEFRMKKMELDQTVSNANTKFFGDTIQSLLNFTGSAIEWKADLDKRTDAIQNGAYIYDPKYKVETGGQAIIDRENNQAVVESAEESALVDAYPDNPLEREKARIALGANQTTERLQRQISIGEAGSKIFSDLPTLFYDPNTYVTLPNGDRIRPTQADASEVDEVVASLAYTLTKGYNLKRTGIDEYAIVTQYIPKLESAKAALLSKALPEAQLARQNNAEYTANTAAGQYLRSTGDVPGSYTKFYDSAKDSGLYGNDQRKITNAAFDAFIAAADQGQLRALKTERVFEGGPTFEKDRRYSQKLEDAINGFDQRVIDANTRKQQLGDIDLDKANNLYSKSILSAQTQQEVIAANQTYDKSLEALAAEGNQKARAALAERSTISEAYTPNLFTSLRESIMYDNESYSQAYFDDLLRQGLLKPAEYETLIKTGVATNEQVANLFGSPEEYKAANAAIPGKIELALGDKLGTLSADVKNGFVAPVAADIIKRRDDAVRNYVLNNPGAKPADTKKFADDWVRENLPGLIAGVKQDGDNGPLVGYEYYGAKPGQLSTYSNAYTQKAAQDMSGLDYKQLETFRNSGLDLVSNKVLTTRERNEGIQAYTTDGLNYPNSVTGKADALGVDVNDFVRMQAAGAGFKLGEKPAETIENLKSSQPYERQALDLIARYESVGKGEYNAVNEGGRAGGTDVVGYSGDIRSLPGGPGKPLTEMSMDEVAAMQASGQVWAAGRYQMVPDTFNWVREKMGIDGSQKYDEATQDKMGLWLLRNAHNGLGQWVGVVKKASAEEMRIINQARTIQRINRNPNATNAQRRRAAQYTRSFTGAMTYQQNKQKYIAAGSALQAAGFTVKEQGDFSPVTGGHASNSYHKFDEAFDVTLVKGTRAEDIETTGRLQDVIQSLGLFEEVIGPRSNDPQHKAHLHLGGLLRPITQADIDAINAITK